MDSSRLKLWPSLRLIGETLRWCGVVWLTISLSLATSYLREHTKRKMAIGFIKISYSIFSLPDYGEAETRVINVIYSECVFPFCVCRYTKKWFDQILFCVNVARSNITTERFLSMKDFLLFRMWEDFVCAHYFVLA